jgi:hypothetical protein
MYWKNKNTIANKTNTTYNSVKASVIIENKEVVINHDFFKKRDKVIT